MHETIHDDLAAVTTLALFVYNISVCNMVHKILQIGS